MSGGELLFARDVNAWPERAQQQLSNSFEESIGLNVKRWCDATGMQVLTSNGQHVSSAHSEIEMSITLRANRLIVIALALGLFAVSGGTAVAQTDDVTNGETQRGQ